MRGENASGTVVGQALDADLGSNVAFLLDGAGFRILPSSSDDYRNAVPSAINDEGDAVGTGYLRDDTAVPVRWPAGDLDHPVLIGDGTILLNDHAGGMYLWRDGVTTSPPAPPGYPVISGGSLSGTQLVASAPAAARPGSEGLVWCRPDKPATCRSGQPRVLPGSEHALFVNDSGVIVGHERGDGVDGPLAVWNGLEYVERLEVPPGQQGSAGAIGDDGSIAGYVAGSLGEQPAVWRLVAG